MGTCVLPSVIFGRCSWWYLFARIYNYNVFCFILLCLVVYCAMMDFKWWAVHVDGWRRERWHRSSIQDLTVTLCRFLKKKNEYLTASSTQPIYLSSRSDKNAFVFLNFHDFIILESHEDFISHSLKLKFTLNRISFNVISCL